MSLRHKTRARGTVYAWTWWTGRRMRHMRSRRTNKSLDLAPHRIVRSYMLTSQRTLPTASRILPPRQRRNLLAALCVGGVVRCREVHAQHIRQMSTSPGFLSSTDFRCASPSFHLSSVLVSNAQHPDACTILTPLTASFIYFSLLFPIPITGQLKAFIEKHASPLRFPS